MHTEDNGNDDDNDDGEEEEEEEEAELEGVLDEEGDHVTVTVL